MKTIRNLLTLAAVLAMVQPVPAAVPSTINYQGRLTNPLGVVQTGTKSMSLKIYDAATAGTQLYAETIGNVTVDANGVYGFQFGTAGTSDALVTETIATTDGSTLTYQKTLSNTPVLPGTVSVTDGTYSWNETTGNPGSPATATTNVISGFVVGATITDGGSGYASAPTVTITGNGTGAAATATVSNGTVSEITITNAGSGYTTGATISIAPPPAPFVINYSGGTITANYASAPAAGQTITATYRYSASGISGALAAGPEQWLELTVDGTAQSPRQKVLAVPFAMNAGVADQAKSLVSQVVVWRPEAFMLRPEYAGQAQSPTLPLKITSGQPSTGTEAIIPSNFRKITKVDLDFTITEDNLPQCKFQIVRYRADVGEEILYDYSKGGSATQNGRLTDSIEMNIIVNQSLIYKIKLYIKKEPYTINLISINDVKITAN
jgi:hypothetical protein